MKKLCNKMGFYSKEKKNLKCWSRVKLAVILIKGKH